MSTLLHLITKYFYFATDYAQESFCGSHNSMDGKLSLGLLVHELCCSPCVCVCVACTQTALSIPVKYDIEKKLAGESAASLC